MWFIVIVVLLAVIIGRSWFVLPNRVRLFLFPFLSSYVRNSRKKLSRTKETCATLIILGSGGHTTEMLKLITKLNRQHYCPIGFVLAESDQTSQENVTRQWKPSQANCFYRIPRSREVGQSWSSTIWTTLGSTMKCYGLVAEFQPDLIICNGPGTCIPICFLVRFREYVGLAKKCKIIFCESFCRVKSLSFTGRLCYYIADRFIVHWPELQLKYPSSEYIGVIG